MSAEIIPFPWPANDRQPDAVLDEAKGALASCLVLGIDHDGQVRMHTSTPDPVEIAWLLEMGDRILCAARRIRDRIERGRRR